MGNLANARFRWMGEWYTDDNGRVTWLLLRDNQLSGELPAELGNLADLEVLDLGDNQLSGELPRELGNLANLRQLRLGNNQLSGELPSEFGNLSNLESLYLHNNQFIGCVPGSLQGQLDMTYSDLGGLPYCTVRTSPRRRRPRRDGPGSAQAAQPAPAGAEPHCEEGP